MGNCKWKIYQYVALLFFSLLNADEMIKGETTMAYGHPMSTWALLGQLPVRQWVVSFPKRIRYYLLEKW